MTNPVKPWSNHRQVLWAIGVFSLLLLAFGLFMVWFLQGGFDSGKQKSPPGLADLFGTLLLGIPCVYYIVVAHRAWSRKIQRSEWRRVAFRFDIRSCGVRKLTTSDQRVAGSSPAGRRHFVSATCPERLVAQGDLKDLQPPSFPLKREARP